MPDPRYEARDLLRVPSLLSLARLPLAAVFPLALGDVRAAFGVLAAASLSDVLDGWWARRFHQATALGAVVDGACDKVFVATVAVTLGVTHRLSWPEVLLLGARDGGEAVLAAVVLSRGDARARHEEQRAGPWGKAATMVQFVAVVLAVARMPGVLACCALCAACGAVAVATYARRAL